MYYNEQLEMAETKPQYRSIWDKIGISASLICVVHCILLPIFFSALPFFGIEILENPAIEMITIGISFMAGSWALINGYRQYHKNWLLILFIIGILLLIVSNTIVTKRSLEIALKSVAAAAIVTAHAYNWKFSKKCAINH
ncbi:MAG TPA: MerC domain-containing protein [Puia sp.]|nr:MerC domain-containing protein [Puia sp.]